MVHLKDGVCLSLPLHKMFHGQLVISVHLNVSFFECASAQAAKKILGFK